jgi:integrase
VIGPKTTCEEINQEFLTEVAKGLTRPGSTPASFKRQVIAPVAAVQRFANSQWGAGQGCPLQTFRSVRQPIVSKNILWPSEAQDLVRLASANGDYQLVAIIVIGVCEGLRRAELHNLRWTAIDRMRQVTMVEDCKGDEFDKRTRIISDARPATWAALDHLKRQRDQTSDRLFTGVRGDPVGLQAFGNTTNAALRKLAAQAGIRKRVHLHLLRHSAASWHYAVVKDFERVRVRMDWRSLAITHRYVHLLPPHLVSEVEDFWNAKGFD